MSAVEAEVSSSGDHPPSKPDDVSDQKDKASNEEVRKMATTHAPTPTLTIPPWPALQRESNTLIQKGVISECMAPSRLPI